MNHKSWCESNQIYYFHKMKQISRFSLLTPPSLSDRDVCHIEKAQPPPTSNAPAFLPSHPWTLKFFFFFVSCFIFQVLPSSVTQSESKSRCLVFALTFSSRRPHCLHPFRHPLSHSALSSFSSSPHPPTALLVSHSVLVSTACVMNYVQLACLMKESSCPMNNRCWVE